MFSFPPTPRKQENKNFYIRASERFPYLQAFHWKIRRCYQGRSIGKLFCFLKFFSILFENFAEFCCTKNLRENGKI